MSDTKAFHGYNLGQRSNDDLPEENTDKMLEDELREYNVFRELMSDKWPDIQEGPLWRLMRQVFNEAREDLRNE